jgi:hypothetical protein
MAIRIFKLVIGWLWCFKLFFVQERRNFTNTFPKIPFFLFVIQKPKVCYVPLKSVIILQAKQSTGIYKKRFRKLIFSATLDFAGKQIS